MVPNDIISILKSFRHRAHKDREISHLRDYYDLIMSHYTDIIAESSIELKSFTKYTSFTELISNNPYIPKDIRHNIDEKMNQSFVFEIKYKSISIMFTLVSSIGKNIDQHFLEMMLHSSILLHSLGLDTTKIKNQSTIYVFLTHLNKKIKKDSVILGPININTGVTTRYSSDKIVNETIVFREDEVLKTIIHEMIHNVGMDFNVDIPYRDILHYFNINPNTELVLNEAYTEVLANIINSMVCSFESKNKANFPLFKQNLNNEINFSLFQVAKILLHYKFESVSDFTRPYDSLDRFKQETHVFSYFFVKAALLFNISNVTQFLMNNTIQLYINDNSVNEFRQLIMDSIFNKDYLKSLDQYMIFIKKTKLPRHIKDTLRMTLIQN